MTVQAKGNDGLGWYILEVDADDKRFLRHWERYNVKEVALANGQRMFPGESICVGFWNGRDWERNWYDGVEPPKPVDRLYPDLLTADERKALLAEAEQLWRDLQANNLGGFSDGNRPFWIEARMRAVIEQFGRRDIGQTWSKDALDVHPDRPKS